MKLTAELFATVRESSGVKRRTCKGCGGDFPQTCVAECSTPGLGGYWHLKCLRKARANAAKVPVR